MKYLSKKKYYIGNNRKQLNKTNLDNCILILYFNSRVFFALSLCANSVGNMFSYIQDYAKARYSIRLLNYLLSRKSEIDSSSLTGAKPVSNSVYHSYFNNYFLI